MSREVIPGLGSPTSGKTAEERKPLHRRSYASLRADVMRHGDIDNDYTRSVTAEMQRRLVPGVTIRWRDRKMARKGKVTRVDADNITAESRGESYVVPRRMVSDAGWES